MHIHVLAFFDTVVFLKQTTLSQRGKKYLKMELRFNIKLDFKLFYCNRRNFRKRFSFVYFALLAENTKSTCTYTSVSCTAVAV